MAHIVKAESLDEDLRKVYHVYPRVRYSASGGLCGATAVGTEYFVMIKNK